MTKRKKPKLPHQVYVSHNTRAINPAVDNTMWFENGFSLEALLETFTNGGDHVKIHSIKITVRTESTCQHWVQPLVVKTSGAISDVVDISPTTYQTVLNAVIVGPNKYVLLGHPKFSRDVPGNDVANAVSEGINPFVVELPRSILDSIEAGEGDTDKTEENSVCFLGFQDVAVADTNLFWYTEIVFDYIPGHTGPW